MPQRYSRIEARLDAANRTPEGYIDAIVPVTRCGVFPYRNQDGSMRYELRHPKEVFAKASLESLRLLPVQVEHRAMLDASNIDQFKVGHLGSDVEIDGEKVCVPLRIDGKAGIQAVDSGKKELSCGYTLELVAAPAGASYDGQAYTHEQKNIRYNHLAITDRARLGPDLRIDSEDAIEADGQENHTREDSSMLKKINVDSVDYEVPPQVAVYVEKLRGRADTAEEEAKAKAEELKALEADKKKGMDSLQAKVDVLTADLAKAKLDAAEAIKNAPVIAEKIAKDRADIMLVAQAILPSDKLKACDSMDNAAVKAAVIAHKMPTIKLDGASADYIQGVFQAVSDGIEKNGTDAHANNRATSTDAANGDNKYSGMTALDAARAKQNDRVTNAYKTKK